MPSYLDAPFLADLNGYDDATDLSGPTVATPVSPRMPTVSDNVSLPGGIIIPRKTLWIIVGIVVAVGIYLYLKRKKSSGD